MCYLKTTFGVFGLTESNGAIIRVWFPSEITGRHHDSATTLIRQAFQELEEYFAGSRQTFTIPVAPVGTPFQQSVWRALSAIPYGQTATYGEIAQLIGRPGASRAVGTACNRNPVPLLIPCHRVVASDGGLAGYRGGISLKSRLLKLEQT